MSERIVLGCGNCIDYEVSWDSRVLERLIAEHGIGACETGTGGSISSTRDLVVSILGFLKSGTGGGHFVDSPSVIEDFAGLFQKKVTMGGTAVRAAIAMGKLGHTSALHLVTVSDEVRKQIPRNCPWVCSSKKDSSYPHLIVQFPEDARVRVGGIVIKAPRANRVIYENDPDNTAMELDPGLASLASDARVFLVSGFNAMRSSALLANRMEALVKVLASIPADALVFYEDAGFHEPALAWQVRDALVNSIDIFSLNEDEMTGYLGRRVALLDPIEVHCALRELHRLLPVPALLVHTRYWALAFGPNAGRYQKPLKGGITMAATRLRFGDDFTPANYRETEGLPEEPFGKEFAEALGAEAGDAVCCLPAVQAGESVATTVGLGDAFVGGALPKLAQM